MLSRSNLNFGSFQAYIMSVVKEKGSHRAAGFLIRTDSRLFHLKNNRNILTIYLKYFKVSYHL